jgi:hypothetical protein
MTINGSDCWWYIYTSDGGTNRTVKALHYDSGSTNNISVSGDYTNNGQDWQHMVITNNPNGQLKIYVNNSLVASGNSTTSTANYNSGIYRADITPAAGGSTGSCN